MLRKAVDCRQAGKLAPYRKRVIFARINEMLQCLACELHPDAQRLEAAAERFQHFFSALCVQLQVAFAVWSCNIMAGMIANTCNHNQ